MEYILLNALLSLLETPGSTLVALKRLLGDSAFRGTVTAKVNDPLVRSFWRDEFERWKPALQAEATAPIQNKIGAFLSSPLLRGIVGQSDRSIDLRRVMDDGRVFIVNLSKGRIGEQASTLLGSLLVTGLQQAAMARADTPEADRRDYVLYVDEFQNFATESFATILSEARKYRLSLVVANQYLAQMDEQTQEAVFGNVGSILCFQVGPGDAEILAEQLGGDVTPQDLIAMRRFTAYARLLVQGMPSKPFSLQTLPPPRSREQEDQTDVIRRVSRGRYARRASQVERHIDRQMAAD